MLRRRAARCGTNRARGDVDRIAGTTARDAARTERGADIDECAAGRPPSVATVAEVQRCLGADIGVARPASCRRSEMHGLIRTMHSQATSNTNSAAAYRAVTASDAYSDVARRGGAGAIARAMRGSRLSEHNGPALQAVLHSLPKHGDAQPSLEHLRHAFYEEAKGTLCAFAVRAKCGGRRYRPRVRPFRRHLETSDALGEGEPDASRLYSRRYHRRACVRG